jgi:transaldolase
MLCYCIQLKGDDAMKATQSLHDLGQSIWLDNITRDILNNGTLKRYIDEFSVTGLTSNPTIFEHAISNSASYDEDIAGFNERGVHGEQLFFELALQDLRRAADLFLPTHTRTNGIDGFVSLEVSPRLAYDTKASIASAKELHGKASRANLFIKIPGTKEGNPAIEEAIFSGVAVNVTLLFSVDHYLASAEAYLRGIERRIDAGLSPNVRSVASLFLSRWDKATMDKVPAELRDKLGIAVGRETYKAYRDILDSDRWQRLANLGAQPQRLLFASTGTKDPKASDTLYISALAAPNTIDTMPEETLLAFHDHGAVTGSIPRDGGDFKAVLDGFGKAGIDIKKLAADLQSEGAASFNKSWDSLLKTIQSKSESLQTK